LTYEVRVREAVQKVPMSARVMGAGSNLITINEEEGSSKDEGMNDENEMPNE
jgi:hypothetical protein